MQLSASIPPPPKDADEAQRVEHTRLRRRLLYSQYEPDLDARIRQAVGNVKAEAWKPIDLTANPYLSIWQQTAVRYDLAPEVATLAGSEPVAEALVEAGAWPLMQRVQRDTMGLREMLLRVSVADGSGEVVVRPVFPDMVSIETDPREPTRPVKIKEWLHDPKHGWVRHVYDISRPASPSYLAAKPDGSLVSAQVLGGTFDGEAYPFRKSDGTPILPFVLYHAAQAATVFDAYTMREVVEGSLMLGIYLTFFGHVLRDASWPQRYVIGARVLGAESVDGEGNVLAGRREVVTDPATLLEMEPDPNGSGQPMVGQWNASADPAKMLEAISMYERRVLTLAGIEAPDVTRQDADIRSGYSLAVSREQVRTLQRVYEPQFRRGDLQLCAVSATLLNRANGTHYAEEAAAYRITYKGLPKSPGERMAELAEIKARTDAGLVGPVTAYQELNPGTPFAEAFTRVVDARLEASTVDAAVSARGASPTTVTGDSGPKLVLAPTDIATVVTVNEARASQGLPPSAGPDGALTITEYKAKNAAIVAEAAAAGAGTSPPADAPA